MRYEDYIPKELVIDNSLKLRAIEEKDKNNYIELQRLNDTDNENYSDEGFRNIIWKINEIFLFVIIYIRQCSRYKKNQSKYKKMLKKAGAPKTSKITK